MYISEQPPLKLNSVEVCEVIAAVCSEAPSPAANLMTMSSKLSDRNGKPSMDVATSILIKLVIDMYVLLPSIFLLIHVALCSYILHYLLKAECVFKTLKIPQRFNCCPRILI